MPNKKISALTAVTTPIDRTTDSLPFVQGGVTKKISAEDLTGEYEVTGTLTTAEILDLNTTRQLAISAPGAGYYIRIIRADAWIDYNSAPYAASTNLALWYDTATRPAFAFPKILESTVSTGEMGVLQDMSIATHTLMLINEALYFKPFSAVNPTTGDSDIKYRIRYAIESEL